MHIVYKNMYNIFVFIHFSGHSINLKGGIFLKLRYVADFLPVVRHNVPVELVLVLGPVGGLDAVLQGQQVGRGRAL